MFLCPQPPVWNTKPLPVPSDGSGPLFTCSPVLETQSQLAGQDFHPAILNEDGAALQSQQPTPGQVHFQVMPLRYQGDRNVQTPCQFDLLECPVRCPRSSQLPHQENVPIAVRWQFPVVCVEWCYGDTPLNSSTNSPLTPHPLDARVF